MNAVFSEGPISIKRSIRRRDSMDAVDVRGPAKHECKLLISLVIVFQNERYMPCGKYRGSGSKSR